MKRYNIIEKENKMYDRILHFIFTKQAGLCRFCGKNIVLRRDTVVSAGNNLRKYYHVKCAERIHIL
jgi:hypothetical protein